MNMRLIRQCVALLSALLFLSGPMAAVAFPAGNSVVSIGVNVSGAEYSWMPFAGKKDFAYLKSKGVSLIRLPISWERMQPKLGGPLNSSYLSGLMTALDNAAAQGIKVIVDVHNYGLYNKNWTADGNISPGSAGSSIIGSAELPVAAFAGFWSLLADKLAGHAGLAGYDIMNEPHDMGNAAIWPKAAQSAVTAIRTADKDTTIYVEGDQWSGALNWRNNNENFHVSDSANNIVYEAHSYFDSDGSGQYKQTYAQQGANSNAGVDAVRPFLQWLKDHHHRGFIGEFGVPRSDTNNIKGADNSKWNLVLEKFLNALAADGVSCAYWNYVYRDANPFGESRSWWPTYEQLNIRSYDGKPQPQMDAISRYLQPRKQTGDKYI